VLTRLRSTTGVVSDSTSDLARRSGATTVPGHAGDVPELRDIPPAEHEKNHYRQNLAITTLETREPSLH